MNVLHEHFRTIFFAVKHNFLCESLAKCSSRAFPHTFLQLNIIFSANFAELFFANFSAILFAVKHNFVSRKFCINVPLRAFPQTIFSPRTMVAEKIVFVSTPAPSEEMMLLLL